MHRLLVLPLLLLVQAACSAQRAVSSDIPRSGGETARETGVPVRRVAIESLADSKVTVEVYLDDQAFCGTALSCWTYVTNGLAAFNHPDLAVAVKREPGDAETGYPREVLETFRDLAALIGQGKKLVPWSAMRTTEVRGAQNDFIGLLALPPASANASFGRPYLSLLFVTGDELQVAAVFGAPRVAGLLGRTYRHYPTVPWLDRNRPSVVSLADLEESLVIRTGARVWVAGAGVWKEVKGKRTVKEGPPGLSEAALEGDTGDVVLRLTPSTAGVLEGAMARAGAGRVLVAMMPPAPNADARAVWNPRNRETSAITGPKADPVRIAGNFVILLQAANVVGAQSLEDGYVVTLPGEAWVRLREAMRTKSPFAMAPSHGRAGFEIDWVPDTGEPELNAKLELTPEVPRDVAYEIASKEVNDAAQRKLADFLSERTADGAAQLFEGMLTCGPFLWEKLKGAPEASELGVPAKMLHPGGGELQRFEGRVFRSTEEVGAFARGLSVGLAPGERFQVRLLTTDELALYWALIPFDISEPVFIAESKSHKLLANFTDDGRVFWVDDFAGVSLDEGRVVAGPK